MFQLSGYSLVRSSRVDNNNKEFSRYFPGEPNVSKWKVMEFYIVVAFLETKQLQYSRKDLK